MTRAGRPTGCLTLHETAAELSTPAKDLFALLRAKGVLDLRNAATPPYIRRGFFRVRYGTFTHKTRGQQHYSRTYVTPEGVEWVGRLLAAEQRKSA